MTHHLIRFKQLIKARCGLMFEGNSEANLQQVLNERARILALEPASYYERLKSSVAEFQELVNRLTINETYFFRESEQIRLLVDHLVPRFLARREGRAALRILSAGCSSGEEPYSLAMALMDKYGERSAGLFDIHGADIDSAALAKARNARYTRFSFRGVSDEAQSRYFDKEDWGHVLKVSVRKQVSFHSLNLLAESLPPQLNDFDIVFFRNVSIYFDAPTRQRVQHKLASMMKDQGVLVMGAAETLANDLGVLPLVEDAGQFYFVKGGSSWPAQNPQTMMPDRATPVTTPPLPQLHMALERVPVQRPSAIADVLQVPLPDFETLYGLVRDKQFDQALPLLDAVLIQAGSSTWARLLKANVLINRKEFSAAENLAQEVLAADAWSIDALLLLGLAAKWQQQPEVAVRWFKQATYSRHECWPAQYYLADLYRRGGESDLARRAYRVVIQLLSDKEPDTGIQYLPLDLPIGQVRFLCEHQLAKLPVDKALESQR
ncbi:MAG: chemotaxis protein methyltransferase CheR [Comamonadaceae bacterium]|nr:MAG: chemotaxis protein methyltransferase CheR [Comamonadaceae bacterium]